MHILASTSATIEDLAEPIDLRQPPAPMLAVSFTDSDLLALAAAWRSERHSLPALRLARLKDLRHPMSVDLWLDRSARHAQVIVARVLGGLDWWRYGAERLAETARAHGIALALLSGEDQDDPRLAALSTIPEEEWTRWLGYFRQGGPDNMRALLRLAAARAAGTVADAPPPRPAPAADFYERAGALVRPGAGPARVLPLADPLPDRPLPNPPPHAGEGGAVSGVEGGRQGPDGAGISHHVSGQPETDQPESGPAGAAPGPAPIAGATGPLSRMRGRVGEGDGREETEAANRANTEHGKSREQARTQHHPSAAQPDQAPDAPQGAAPRALILFYRSLWLAGDTAAIDGLCAALEARGIGALPLFVSSLKDPAARAVVHEALRAQAPDLVITTTAFAAGDGDDLFPAGGPAVLQAIVGTTAFSAWQASPRGLAASDLAMHVVLPELDGRVLAGAISFKDGAAVDPDLAFTATRNRPEPEGIALVAERAARLIALARRPRAQRRLAVLMPDYPGAAGRTGYAVGLDVPESACAVLARLAAEGYDVPPAPAGARALLDSIRPRPGLSLADYRCRLARLPQALQDAMAGAWGDPEEDDDLADGAFAVRCARFGTVTVALAPERGRALDRRADYHDPALPPRHALLAFGLWLQETCDALVHLGAHGTLEWLPGKAAALTPACFPRAVLGALPVAYPFLVSNPGEAAQAKRRIAGVTIGHLPPPMTSAGLGAAEQRLERLVDEYAAADGLDTRRRDRLAGLIVEAARETGLARHAGVDGDTAPDEALKRIDAWLCDVKDLAIKDGQHVFGAPSEDGERHASGAAEMAALLTALDGHHVAPGPAGAPARGRRDVLPTGRNLFTADPRSLPSPTAMDLGKLAADEIIRAHLQDHGDYPRAVIIDLWGSATLRTGGEEIAQGLCLMGCRPQWDAATGRVTGIEVLPPAVLGRPRVDVTWRVSGLFRDIFPAQIALLDAAARAVGARSEEAEGDNPLALSLASGGDGARIFGTAPGTYGAGVEERLASGAFTDRAELGQAYLDAASHAYGGAEGAARESGGAFSQRVAQADALIHTSDDAGRDLLDGGADVAFVGGFAAAAALLGKAADLVMLNTADPQRPRARPLAEALARLVHGRVSARFIAGQMRHGPRGASELLETVDRLVAFAETTGMVASDLMDRLHDAYLGDPEVRAFLLRENPAAAREMARRFSDARRRGLWHARRNDLDHDLEALAAEARTAGVTAEAAE